MGQAEAKGVAMECLLDHYHESLEEPAAVELLAKDLMQDVLLALARHCRVRRKVADESLASPKSPASRVSSPAAAAASALTIDTKRKG